MRGSKVSFKFLFSCGLGIAVNTQLADKEALSQLDPKKKIFETIQPGFTTLDSREAAWVDPAKKSVHKIRTKDGVCLAPNFVGASLS